MGALQWHHVPTGIRHAKAPMNGSAMDADARPDLMLWSGRSETTYPERKHHVLLCSFYPSSCSLVLLPPPVRRELSCDVDLAGPCVASHSGFSTVQVSPGGDGAHTRDGTLCCLFA